MHDATVKIQNILIVCRDHSTAKVIIVLVKIPVQWLNGDEYQMLEIKMVVWCMVMWGDVHRKYVR
jgi:hypothetical protein